MQTKFKPENFVEKKLSFKINSNLYFGCSLISFKNQITFNVRFVTNSRGLKKKKKID